MQPLKTIAKGASLIFIGIFLSKLLTYFYRMVVARIGVEEYGLLSLGLAVFGILTTISMLGLSTGVTRYFAFYKAKKDLSKVKGVIFSSLKMTIPVAIILSLILFFFSNSISVFFFHNIKLSPILKIFSIGFFFFLLKEIFCSAIVGAKKISYDVFTRNFFENFMRILLTLLLIYLGYGLFGATVAYVLSIILTAFVSFYFLNKIFPLFSKIKTNFITKEITKYSLPLLFSSILTQVIVWTDVLMIGYFRTTSEVGIYNIALPTATLLAIIPGGIIGIFLPVMTELLAKNKNKEFKQTLKISSKWIFFINLPIFFILLLFSKQILLFLFGKEYLAGNSALIILCSGYIIYQTFNICRSTLNVIKKTKINLINTVVAALINIILNYILIPKYGMIGGAIATSTSLIIFGILVFIEVYYLTKIISIKWNYLKAIIAGLLTMFFITKINLNFILLIIIFLIIYSFFLIILRSLEREDIEILKAVEIKSGIKLGFLRDIIKKFI